MSETAPSGAIKSGESYVEFIAVDGKLNKSLTSIGNRLKTFGSFATKAGALLTAAGAGAATGILALAQAAADAGSAVDDMSQRTGIAVKFISEMRYAAGMSGTSIEAFEKAIVAMSKAMYGADEESKQALKTLENLGLSVEDLKGKKPEEAFLVISEALSKVEDPTRRTALALKIFGKSGAELIPVLSGGRAGIEEMMKAAEKLGYSLSKEDAEAAAKLGDEIDAVKMAFGGMTTQIGLAVAGPLTEWATWMKDQIPELTKWLKENQGVVVTVAKIAAGAAIAGAALTAFGVATTGVGLGMTQAVGAANGLMKGLKGLGSVAAGGGGLLAIAAIATAIGLAIARWASNTEEYNKQLAISKRLNTELEDIDRKRTQKSLDENRGKASLAQRKKDIDEKIRIAEKNVHGSGQGVQNAENNVTAANGWGNWFLDNTVGSSELDSLRTDVKDAEDKRESDRQNLQSLLDERATIDAQLTDQKKMQDAMKPSTIKWAGRVGGRVAGMARNWGQGVFSSGVGLAEAAKEQSARIDDADIERRQGLFDEAKAIKESNKTPAEKRKERLAKIDELRTSGALGDQDAAMARAKIGLEAAQEKSDQLAGRVNKREQLNLGISEDQKSFLASQAGRMSIEDEIRKNSKDTVLTLDEMLLETKRLRADLAANGVVLAEVDG